MASAAIDGTYDGVTVELVCDDRNWRQERGKGHAEVDSRLRLPDSAQRTQSEIPGSGGHEFVPWNTDETG